MRTRDWLVLVNSRVAVGAEWAGVSGPGEGAWVGVWSPGGGVGVGVGSNAA